jgi:SNF2 family DNA or RNA helicase
MHDEQRPSQERMRLLADLMRLRRAACHPQLVAPELQVGSAKLATFLSIVDELRDEGHRALVFSQFVDHLEIVRKALDERGVSYQYLDGSTPQDERARAVRAFQAGEGDLFLISLRAGGFGLNLTAADYVVHLDPWWNPAVEDQATDRAHRIGQTKPLTVYRLVTRDTVEEKILVLHEGKRALLDNLLEGAGAGGALDLDELRAILGDTTELRQASQAY